MCIGNTVEQLEEKYGDLQNCYNDWRRKTEEKNAVGEKSYRFTDAAFAEARESFSEYCGMTETIPFDAMLWYETNYSDK